METTAPLIDPFARAISYLRVSVTDRCDFRCVYCMSENMTFLPKKELLTLEELDRMCSTFIRLGVEKLRITGGEPLVRRDIMTFFRAMTRHLDAGTLKELTLTTNGSQLSRFAGELFDAGVRRVNVSLDTLDEAKFAEITRWGRLPQVLKGIDAAQAAGLRVKINAVALKGFNEDELFDLQAWCASRDMDLTFIEVMPMGDLGNEDRLDQYWSLKDLRARLAERFTLIDLAERTGGPARYVQLQETGQKIGFITPLTHNFCELQPRAPDLHRGAFHVPRAGGHGRPARPAPRLPRRRDAGGRDPRSHRTQAQGPRFRLFPPEGGRAGIAAHEPYGGVRGHSAPRATIAGPCGPISSNSPTSENEKLITTSKTAKKTCSFAMMSSGQAIRVAAAGPSDRPSPVNS
jgi:cyclic pyranopterin phosphate synthase